jgi:glycerol-3-phosphate dehydrogenase
MDRASVTIIGGGVVGCAIAAALAERYDDVFLLEALPRVGMLTSSRNSGVIHAGLYYPPNSLKAKHCLRGNRLTYEFCAAHAVPHRRTGKLVVARSAAERSALMALLANAEANGVENLKIIDRAAIRAREPHVEGSQAIDVPSTGILASEELVKAYARVASTRGAHIVTNAKAERLEAFEDSVRVTSSVGALETSCLINSAGLFAADVAAMLGSRMASHTVYPLRGEYCELVRAKGDWVNGLVYPLPPADGASIGIHLTKTLSDSVLIGPTARYVDDRSDYESDRLPLEYFVEQVRPILPGVELSDVRPSYSGIRPKLQPPSASGPDRKNQDFIIERDPDFPRVIELMGIESPGLTSAPSIALSVREMVGEILN